MLNLNHAARQQQQQGRGGDEITVSLRNMPAPTQRPVLKLYFIGYKTMRPNTRQVPLIEKGKQVIREGRPVMVEEITGYSPPICNISGRVIQLPPIGGYLEVSDIIANELAYRLMWQEKDMPPIPGVTLDPVIAQAVQRAYEAGDVEHIDVRAMVSQSVLTNMDEAALIAELQRRNPGLEVVLPEPAQEGGSE